MAEYVPPLDDIRFTLEHVTDLRALAALPEFEHADPDTVMGLLDEPSSNLDPASRRELADILRSLDVTVLMVTHDLPYALELCPRSVVLSGGTVVADGSTYDVLTDEALMREHRLELPFGFDPRTAMPHP